MPATHDDLNTVMTAIARASAPARQFNEMIMQNSAQLLRFQYALLGDWLNFCIDQGTAMATATDAAQLVGGPAAIGARFLESSLRRGEELMQMSADMQSRFAAWADRAFDPDA